MKLIENIHSIIVYFLGFSLLTLGVLFTYNSFETANYDALIWAILIEGLLLGIIIVLYVSQVRLNKKINEEKDEAFNLLENRLAAMEAAADGIGIVDTEGNLVYMNKALKDLHGIEEGREAEFIGKPWAELYSKKGKDQIDNVVLPHLYETGAWRGDSPIVRMDGEVVYAAMSLTLLKDGSFIGTARDITGERKNAEEREHLEQQFYQAQKMEAIGRLAGGVAHDFNNILAAITGYAEFLEEDLKDQPDLKKFAKNILVAGNQAKDLVEQMLAFSRQKQSASEVTDLRASIKEAMSMLNASLPKTVELNNEVKLESAPIHGNSTQISQVIMNLGVNASDALEDEHGKIDITLELADMSDESIQPILSDDMPLDDVIPIADIEDVDASRSILRLGTIFRDAPYVKLTVQDSGCGMSKAIMQHIFEPFFTTKPVDKGTGLGLSMTHGVISSHKGAMVVDSVLAQGTRFDLYFPLVEELVTERLDDIAGGRSERVSGNVLVVEDNEMVQDMMMSLLSREGYDAEKCDTAIEALAVIKENPDHFDLIITDYNMPRMTGLELAESVHMHSPDLPFVMVSGYSHEKLQDMIGDHPAIKAVIRKPLSKDAFVEKINAVLTEAA